MKRLCFVFLIIILFFAACTKKEEPLIGEKGGTLIIGTTEQLATISPLAPSLFSSNEILDLLFMHLHRIDPETGRMKPELASSWEFSEDLTSITYYLRKDVKWWDGIPVTAEDVLYTYERMVDPSTRYPNIASLRFIKRVEMLNTYAIKFIFHKVYADILTDSDIMVIPKHVYEERGSDFGQNPVGNGPYKIKEWNDESGLVLVSNEDYYRGRPPLDEIIIRSYTSVGTMVSDLDKGDLDVVLNITPAAAKLVVSNEEIAVDSRLGNVYTYVGWNLEHNFLKDIHTRRALSMAINKGKILEDVFAGMGTISRGPLPPSSWAYNESVAATKYDLVTAKDILQQRGFEDRNRNRVIDKDGADFVLNIITNIENPERVGMLQLIADDLRALGIRVNTRTLDAPSFISAIVNKEFDGFIMGWSVGEKIDPTVYWHSDSVRGKYNFVSYRNNIVDSLIDTGVAMLNRKKAEEIWGEFQKTIYEEKPYTFLIVPDAIAAHYKHVKGVDQGVLLASAYTYWIPESDRRVTVAAVVEPEEPTPTPPSAEPTGIPPRVIEETPPAVVEPERILEAAAREDTSTVVMATETDTMPEIILAPTPPPRPSVITRTKPIKEVSPKYPESARAIGATGRVVIRILVGTDGKVKKANILSSFGNPACEEAALAAARQWEFTPATRDGVPFEQNVSIPFDFRP
jgi:peptide/nickel transport system substrate-binding protein